MRFPRPVMALVATGVAAASIGLTAVPARADQIRHEEWWLNSLGISHAWAASEGGGVTVAVLSDGVDASQADLTGVVTAAPAPAGAPIATGQYSAEQGTAIASLIAGRGHSSGFSAGILGVAPRARILSIPVTLPADDPELTVTANAQAIPVAIAAGIRYAVSHGATVIDLPLDPGAPGSTGTGGALAAAGGSAAEQSAVDYALKHNVVLVAPAGDDGTSTDAVEYPASYHGVIAVGAFNSAFDKALWSSHQSYVTLTAAGEGVTAADNAGGYQTMNSTTAASAIVSGVAALMRSRYPSLTESQIRKALITSTVYRPANGLANGSGYGSVNADKAMAAAGKLAAPSVAHADAGAQAPAAPAPVAAPAATKSMSAKLIRAGELSGALLVVLLLLVICYLAVTSRRRRKRASAQVASAEWAHRQGQSRYPRAAGSADADRMLEVFTAPVGDGQHAARGGPGSVATVPDRAVHGPADVGRMPGQAPASRAVSRRAPVSGAPPWEPAIAPQGELPWGVEPTEQPAGVHRAGPAQHPRDPRSDADSPWAGAAEWPSDVPPAADDPMSRSWQPDPRQADEAGNEEPPTGQFAPKTTAADWERAREQAQAAHWGSAADLSRVAQRAGWATGPSDQPWPDQSAADQPPAQQPWPEQNPTDQPWAAQHPMEQPWADQPPAQQPWPDQPPAQQPWPEQSPADQPWAAQRPMDQPWADQQAWRQQTPADQPWAAQRPIEQPWADQPPAQSDEAQHGRSPFARRQPRQAESGELQPRPRYRPQSAAPPPVRHARSEPDPQSAFDQELSANEDDLRAGRAAAGPGAHRVSTSGLPVREPRASHARPLSPGGSLWDPDQSTGSSLWDKVESRAESPKATPEGPGRPIFVWNPPGRSDADRESDD